MTISLYIMSLCKASCKSSGISFESLKVYYLREFNNEELLLDYSAVEVCQCEGPHGDSDNFASNEKSPILPGFIQLSDWLIAGPEIQERSKSIPGPRIIGTYLRSLPAWGSWLLSPARFPGVQRQILLLIHIILVYFSETVGTIVLRLLDIVIFIDPVSASVTLSSTPWWLVSLCPR